MGRDRLFIRILVMAISIPVTRILQRLSLKLWHRVRPRPPKGGGRRSTGARAIDVISYATITAAATVAARIITRKAAEQSYKTLVGAPPPPPDEDDF